MSGYDLPIQDDNEREWYAQLGRIQEQERIIKLLEERTTNRNEKGVTIDLQYVEDGIYSFINLTPEITELLIALIKGEK